MNESLQPINDADHAVLQRFIERCEPVDEQAVRRVLNLLCTKAPGLAQQLAELSRRPQGAPVVT